MHQPEEIAAFMQAAMTDKELLFRFLGNFLSIFILVRFIYYPVHRQKDYLFSFFLFNVLIFLLCALLSAARIQFGLAFGLFAVFSLMRYRTVTIPVKEMGYFFVSVSMGMINALATGHHKYWILTASNAIILLLVLVLDRYITLTHENVKEIIYERIDLIRPGAQEALIRDLVQRTGLPIHRVEIVHINFLRDIAVIRAYYYAKGLEPGKPVDEPE